MLDIMTINNSLDQFDSILISWTHRHRIICDESADLSINGRQRRRQRIENEDLFLDKNDLLRN